MAFIVDCYNKYDNWDREHSKYVFEINGQEYAIKEVILFWGKPRLPLRIGENQDSENTSYFIYNSFENAMSFVHTIKSLNRM